MNLVLGLTFSNQKHPTGLQIRKGVPKRRGNVKKETIMVKSGSTRLERFGYKLNACLTHKDRHLNRNFMTAIYKKSKLSFSESTFWLQSVITVKMTSNILELKYFYAKLPYTLLSRYTAET